MTDVQRSATDSLPLPYIVVSQWNDSVTNTVNDSVTNTVSSAGLAHHNAANQVVSSAYRPMQMLHCAVVHVVRVVRLLTPEGCRPGLAVSPVGDTAASMWLSTHTYLQTRNDIQNKNIIILCWSVVALGWSAKNIISWKHFNNCAIKFFGFWHITWDTFW